MILTCAQPLHGCFGNGKGGVLPVQPNGDGNGQANAAFDDHDQVGVDVEDLLGDVCDHGRVQFDKSLLMKRQLIQALEKKKIGTDF